MAVIECVEWHTDVSQFASRKAWQLHQPFKRCNSVNQLLAFISFILVAPILYEAYDLLALYNTFINLNF